MEKSTVPLDSPTPNPAYPRVQVVVENIEHAREVALTIRTMKDRGAAIEEIRRYAHAALAGVYDSYRAVANTPAVMPPSPPASVLYGRFARGANILDVGAGDGRRIKKYVGFLRITANDVADLMPRGHCKKIIMPISELLPALDNVYLTSFMSLCQLDAETQRLLMERDGLHVVPNHADLRQMGALTEVDGRYQVRAPNKIYHDNPVVQAVYDLDVGYALSLSYEKRKFDFDFTPWKERNMNNEIALDVGPLDFFSVNLDDVSSKMDGIPYEYEYIDGVVTKTGRNGKTRAYEIKYVDESKTPSFCFQAEELTNCHTIIRVIYFRDVKPPHGYRALQAFVTAIDITIDGKPLCMPPVAGNVVEKSGHRYVERTDGIITRVFGRDYYVKYQWTFDFYPDDVEKFKNRVQRDGFIVTIDKIGIGLCEYVVKKDSCNISLFYRIQRPDKKRGTTMDTALYMLSHRTAPEIGTLGEM